MEMEERKTTRKAFPRFVSIRRDGVWSITPFWFRGRFVEYNLRFSDSCHPLEFIATCPKPVNETFKDRLTFQCSGCNCAPFDQSCMERRETNSSIIWTQPCSLDSAYYAASLHIWIDDVRNVAPQGLMGDMGPVKWRQLEKMLNGCCDLVDSTLVILSRDLVRMVNEYVFGDGLDFYLNWNKS